MNTPENRLIALLPPADRIRLLSRCDNVELKLSDVLGEPGQTTQHVYFPVNGFVSVLSRVDEHSLVEVGMVGREGMLGVWLALDQIEMPWHSLVQGSGSAWRMSAAHFRRELSRSATLRHNVNRYLFLLIGQLSTSVACQRFHQIGPRLARWLLMSQDRAHSESFHVTHEFLAAMLGVRRVGVTMAAHALQTSGYIEYRRGELTVTDRAGLENAACSCYRSECDAYTRVLNSPAMATDAGG